MGIQITDFLRSFSTDPTTRTNTIYGMHLPVLWTVNITDVSSEDITNVIFKASTKWQANIKLDQMTVNDNILVAQSITLPNESSSFSPMTMGSAMGGYLPPLALDSRANFLERSFSVNFLETGTDIIHEFFRPWMIAIGINGLIEDGTRLKGNMQVIQWSNRGQPLRGFKFIKVFPTAVEGFTLDYANTDFPIKSVTFACQEYEQLRFEEINILDVRSGQTADGNPA